MLSSSAAPVRPSPSPALQAQLEDFLLELNAAAGAVTLPLFRTGLEIANKAGPGAFDPVTAADKGAEAAIRKLIAERFPTHGVIGELLMNGELANLARQFRSNRRVVQRASFVLTNRSPQQSFGPPICGPA